MRDITGIRCRDCGERWNATIEVDRKVGTTDIVHEEDEVCPECGSRNIDFIDPLPYDDGDRALEIAWEREHLKEGE